MNKFGKLERICLTGYKSIQSLDITLSNLNILIGPNGSGKSNFINFFKFMNMIVDKKLQLYVSQNGSAEAFLYFGSKETEEINIDLYFPPNGYKATLVPTQDSRLIFGEEYAAFLPGNTGYSGGDKIPNLTKPGAEESGLPRPGNRTIQEHVSLYLSEWKIYHFHDTGDTAKMKKPCNIDDNDRLSPHGENLAAFLYSIQDTAEYKKIVTTIQRVAPYFHDFILQPDKANENQIRLKWKHRYSDDTYFDANSLSDGTLRFICLTTLLLQPNLPKMILLDEPELGLHPYALQLLGSMLKSVASKTQIIASTQSVTLANQFDYQNIIIVEQCDNTSTFRQLQEDEVNLWLDDYRIGDIWEKNLIGGTPEC